MNICVFIRTLMAGGAEKQSMLLAKALQNKYPTFLVVLHGEHVENKYSFFLEENRINYILLKGNIIKKVFSFIRFLKKEKIDIIFSYLASNNLISAIAGKILRMKYLIGGIQSAEIVKHKLIVQRILHNYFLNFTISNSHSGAENIVKHKFDPEKIQVISNCIEMNTPFFKRTNNQTIEILSVGRFIPAKDYETAIKSIQYLTLLDKNICINFRIIGYGILENQVKDWIAQYEQENNIELIINPENIFDYYKTADIYLCSSVREGLSNTVLEAMSFGLPIVATDVGDNSKLAIDNINGYLVKVKDYKAIAKKMLLLIKSYEKRIAFGKQSYQMLKDTYSLEAFQNQYVRFIEQIVN